MREADLPGALDRNNGKKPNVKTPANDNKNADAKDAEPKKEDYQLIRAVDLLTGLSLYENGRAEATK